MRDLAIISQDTAWTIPYDFAEASERYVAHVS